MRGERHEVDHYITQPSKCQTREQMRAEIEAQVEAFKKAGNEIEEVPRGVSGFVPIPQRKKPASKMQQLAKGNDTNYKKRVWNDGGALIK